MSDSIHSRAMLVSLNISTWTARKFDKRISEEVNRQHAASHDAGRYNKMLLPGDAAAYKALVKAAGLARTEHYANTLAWADDGWRLLPSANYMEYTAIMRKHSATFDTALAEFVAAYPEMREAARTHLNGMYRDSDYPSAGEIGARFRFGIEFSPLPASGDFRLDLPAGEVAEIEARVQDRVRQATEAAMQDAWTRLADSVGKMRERLAEPGAIFRDSLITNVQDIVDVLARLNVTDDPALENMRQRVKADLAAVDPQTLRDAPDVREDTARKAQGILDAMAGVYGGQR